MTTNTEALLKALKDAVEGECDGLAITDAQAQNILDHLRAERAEPLREALEFYADGHHFMRHQAEFWDTVSGEPANFYEDEANTATVEDGSVARAALAGIALPCTDAALPAQQAAPKVPEAMPEPARCKDEPDESFYRRVVYKNGWNACRDAMLAQQPKCSTCDDTGKVYDVSGEGPWDCYACAAPAPSVDATVSAEELYAGMCGYGRIKDGEYKLASMRGNPIMNDGELHPLFTFTDEQLERIHAILTAPQPPAPSEQRKPPTVEEIAAWLETQRNDVPATGKEFAQALRHLRSIRSTGGEHGN